MPLIWVRDFRKENKAHCVSDMELCEPVCSYRFPNDAIGHVFAIPVGEAETCDLCARVVRNAYRWAEHNERIL